MFITPGQNDVSEALMEILENKFLSKEYRNEFVGRYKNTTVCQHCHDRSVAYNEFTILLTELPDDAKTYSVAKLIEKHCSSEFLSKGNEWKCDKCGKETLAQKKSVIDTYPNNLLIGIKRGRRTHKLINPVNINAGITIERNADIYEYKLRATCNHFGVSTHGHYVSISSRPSSVAALAATS